MSGSPMHSALYVGKVAHRRHDRIGHAFAYRLFLVFLDLDELDRVTGPGGALEPRWWRPLRFRRKDYLGPAEQSLGEAVRDRVEQLDGRRPTGAVRMLTNVSAFGYAFNPVTFYYCHEADGSLAGVLAEITNTPWGERFCYFARAGSGGAELATEKAFHVSPFQGMAQRYAWRFSVPAESLAVHMENREGEALVFEASLGMQRRELTRANLRRLCLRHPWPTAKVIAAIHWNALRLWWKGASFHTHPKKRQVAT